MSNTVFQPRKQSAPVLRTLSILLYGVPKVGKTTEAAKFPNAILLNCEPSGTDLLKGEHNIFDVESLDALGNVVPAVVASPYKTIVLDGFTWLINQSVRERIGREGESKRLRIYGQVTEQVQRILGDLLRSGKIVVATGHSRLVDIDDEQDGKVEVRPDINPRLSDGVFGLFSIIAYCYPTKQGSMILTKPEDNEKRRILAGDRSGILPKTMELSAEKMMALLRQTQPQKSGAETKPAGDSKPAATGPALASAETVERLVTAAKQVYGDTWVDQQRRMAQEASGGGAETLTELTEKEAASVMAALQQTKPGDPDPTLWDK